jgi:hypothetical protein
LWEAFNSYSQTDKTLDKKVTGLGPMVTNYKRGQCSPQTEALTQEGGGGGEEEEEEDC